LQGLEGQQGERQESAAARRGNDRPNRKQKVGYSPLHKAPPRPQPYFLSRTHPTSGSKQECAISSDRSWVFSRWRAEKGAGWRGATKPRRPDCRHDLLRRAILAAARVRAPVPASLCQTAVDLLLLAAHRSAERKQKTAITLGGQVLCFKRLLPRPKALEARRRRRKRPLPVRPLLTPPPTHSV